MKQIIASIFLVIALGSPALADSVTYNMNDEIVGNVPSPFGTVTVDLTSPTTAKITFKADGNLKFGQFGAADLNVDALKFTVSNISGGGPYTESSLPGFNLELNDKGKWSQTITLTLTDLSGTWSDADDVLSPNKNGRHVEGHVLEPNGWGGYVTDSTPEPTSLVLLGTALVLVGSFLRKSL